MKIKFTQILTGLFFLAATALNAQVFTVQHSFTNSPDGSRPRNLVLSSNAFYSSTINGGTFANGVIFRFTTDGNLVPLYNFDGGTNGSSPNDVMVSGGKIYGTTQTAGVNSFGTIYSMNTNGTGYSLLYSFTNQPDGQTPKAALILAGTTLYGTTAYGGTNGSGTIFKINTDGSGYAQLRSFTNGTDGQNPFAGLVLNNATLYGTTAYGGTYGNGTIFKINTNGSGYATLYSFSNSPDAQFPYAGLILNSNVLYGTASLGGPSDAGVIFSITTNGTGYTFLHNFMNTPDGGSPQAALTLSGNRLFGTTVSGGTGTFGTLFFLNTDGSGFQIVKSFTNGADGANPQSQPVLVSNVVWSTALLGGATHNGTLFSVQLSPVSTLQPQNFTVGVGGTATFTNVTSGAGPLSYQWYFNTNTILNGNTNAILTLNNIAANQAGYYSVIVTNSFGSVTSSAASLTVMVAATPPSITQQPQNLTVNNGSPASFTNAASGTPTLFYQWYFNTNTPIAGGTAAILNLGNVTTNQAGYYSVIVTNSAGSATSSPALLTVIVPQSPPVIVQQPTPISVTNGYPVSFTNVATGSTLLFYQWYFNTNTSSTNLLGTALAGQTNNILNFVVDTNDIGYYSVIITNLGGAVTSTPALLTLLPAAAIPVVTVQPQPVSAVSGSNATFSVSAAGRNPIVYQWWFNTNFANTNILGKFIVNQTNPVLSFTAITTNRGYYSVVVSNRFGTNISIPALLTVITNPIITLQPQSVTTNSGSPAAFTANAIGAGVLKFQWFFQTNTPVAGGTNLTLNFTNADPSLAGAYMLIVTNNYGRATSSIATLTIVSGPSQPQLLSFAFNPANGNFSLTLSNSANSVNRLWASTNLTSTNFWQAIATNVMAGNGLWFFTDSNAAKTNAVRFYRLSSP